MFDKQIKFYGVHADIMRRLSKPSQSTESNINVKGIDNGTESIYLFDTMISCYMTAAMIGIINKKSVPETKISADGTTNSDTTIFVDVLNTRRNILARIYQHMILSEESELSSDSKIKKAFSIIKDENEQKRLEDYVRGGLEILDDYFKNVTDYESLSYAIMEFSNSFTIE